MDSFHVEEGMSAIAKRTAELDDEIVSLLTLLLQTFELRPHAGATSRETADRLAFIALQIGNPSARMPRTFGVLSSAVTAAIQAGAVPAVSPAVVPFTYDYQKIYTS
jgi:hypothetical protein